MRTATAIIAMIVTYIAGYAIGRAFGLEKDWAWMLQGIASFLMSLSVFISVYETVGPSIKSIPPSVDCDTPDLCHKCGCVTVPSGTTVKIDGIPVALAQDTKVYTSHYDQSKLNRVLSERHGSNPMPPKGDKPKPPVNPPRTR